MEFKTINEKTYLVISNEAYEDKDYVEWLEENHDEAVVSEDFYERELILYQQRFSIAHVVRLIEFQASARDLNNEIDRAMISGQLKLLKKMIDNWYNGNDKALKISYKHVNELLGGRVLEFKDFADW